MVIPGFKESPDRRSSTLILSALLAETGVGGEGADSLKVARAEGLRYGRSFRTANGTIYLPGPFQSTDGRRKLRLSTATDPPWGTMLDGGAMNTLFSCKDLFLAIYEKVHCVPQSGNWDQVGRLFRRTE